MPKEGNKPIWGVGGDGKPRDPENRIQHGKEAKETPQDGSREKSQDKNSAGPKSHQNRLEPGEDASRRDVSKKHLELKDYLVCSTRLDLWEMNYKEVVVFFLIRHLHISEKAKQLSNKVNGILTHFKAQL